ncbi:hypothetical protein [Streptomyces sp. A1499]|uniref:hypothetical protein n=1 Tax=Streptomyces sp. A1499 TaxID=2563104 RepID=UPI00109E7FA8|nr:hypothetical protein [Streptomyces sp. A1499]THC40033.1 hypothetical protein E7X58_37975 [Streptomyces sp. A1499]
MTSPVPAAQTRELVDLSSPKEMTLPDQRKHRPGTNLLTGHAGRRHLTSPLVTEDETTHYESTPT